MTVYLRSQTTIPLTGHPPEDSISWSFAWQHETATDPAPIATIVADRIHILWNNLVGIQGSGGTIGPAAALNMRAAVTKVYDWKEPKPRVPILEVGHTSAVLTNPVGFDLPPEVALVVSYEGSRTSGANMRRRRGRWFLGPVQLFGSAGIDGSIPTNDQLDQVLDAFILSLMPNNQVLLAVYSPYTHWGLAVGDRPPEGQSPPEIAANLDQSFTDVVKVWCDNAWDTQRRRGWKASFRDERAVQEGL